MLVHDANLGREALDRGCVDLVVGGHTHVQSGPDAVDGEDGETGYTWTNGTTGGAAYAFALGSKPRRDADVSLITYATGDRPACSGCGCAPTARGRSATGSPITPGP